jgi:hypothetical protein
VVEDGAVDLARFHRSQDVLSQPPSRGLVFSDGLVDLRAVSYLPSPGPERRPWTNRR